MHSLHAHKTLQYLFCAHLLVKKRWTQKFAFHSDEKKVHTGEHNNNNNTMFSVQT